LYHRFNPWAEASAHVPTSLLIFPDDDDDDDDIQRQLFNTTYTPVTTASASEAISAFFFPLAINTRR
jgi:hypothetical protein